jgi:glycine/D-amino acid oxidase-like deaminating enzyme
MCLRFLCSTALAGAVLLAAGCGGASVAPVSGRVTLDGKPLANAAVHFQPKATENNLNPGPGSDAMTDDNGNFTLKVVTTGQEGAIVGKHRVEISKYARTREIDPTSDQREAPARNLVPAKYNDKTELEFVVPPGGTKEANFNLKSN